jgi:hypothetical protein
MNCKLIFIFGLKHIYLSSIVKQVLATYINHFPDRFLAGTNQDRFHMKKQGSDPIKTRTYNPWVEK